MVSRKVLITKENTTPREFENLSLVRVADENNSFDTLTVRWLVIFSRLVDPTANWLICFDSRF